MPAKIGRYLVIERLGSGATGVVYAAYDPELDRRVAIKCLHPGIRGPESRERLRREAQALARLTYPHVVTVHDVGTWDADGSRRLFIAMTCVAGQNLGAWLRDGRREWRAVLDLLLQAGRGLAAAHGAGLLHRDFKPDNILVEHGDRAQVADFGLACFLDSGESGPQQIPMASLIERAVDLTGPDRLVGTPAYMAPEILKGQVDERSDQFSYCATLYEALYGVRPHSGRSLLQLFNRKLEGALVQPPENRGVPKWIHEAMTRGLEPDPEDRWPSMDALLAELTRDRRRRRISMLGAAALAAAALAAGVGMTAAVRTPATVCETSPTPWRGVWDDGRRGDLRRAFLDAG
ncbi:MAG: serine/threonine-protein kinase, partial [Acidobacteriota bacterium]